MEKNRFEYILLVFIVVLVIAILGFYFVPKAYTLYVRKNPGSLQIEKAEIIGDGKTEYISVTEEMLYFFDGEIFSGKNRKKAFQWDVELETGEWNFYPVKRGTFLVDSQKKQIFFYSKEGEMVWEKHFKIAIAYQNSLEEDLLLLLKEGEEEEWIVLDEKGELKKRKKLENEQFLHAYREGETVYVLSLENDKMPYTTISFYDKEYQEQYRLKLQNQLIYRGFQKENSYYIRTDRELLHVKEGKPLWRKKMEEELISFLPSGNLFLNLQEGKTKRTLLAVDENGEEAFQISVPRSYNQLFLDGEHYYLWDKGSILGYNKEGVLEFEYRSPDYVKQVWFFEKDACIWTGERMITLSFIK